MNIVVESSIELESKHKQALEKKLAQILAEDIKVSFEVDARMLGGLRITTPRKVVDLSLAAKLNQLNSALLTKETIS